MIKEFLRHSAIYTFSNILVRGISILLVPIYTRYLNPVDYGIIDIFAILTSIINLTIALEISQAVPKFYQDSQNIEDKKGYVSTAFWFTLIVYTFFFIITFLFNDFFVKKILNDINLKTTFLLGCLSIVANGLFYFVFNQLKWQILPKESLIVSLINIFITSIVSVILLIVFKLKVESVFIGQIIGFLISSLLAIRFTQNSYSFVFDYYKLRDMIRFSFPLVLSSIAVFVSLYIDRIMINSFLGFYELGIYGIAYRFASIAGIVMVGFQNSLVPLVYKHYKEKETPLKISKIFDIFSVLAILAIGFTIIFSKEIVFLFTTKDYYKSHSLIPILMMSLFFSNMYIFAPGLWIAQKTKLISIIMIFGAFLNFLLNLFLIPKFGILGAGFSTLISALLTLILQIILSNKFYEIPYKKLKLSFCFIIVVISGYLISINFSDINLISILVKIFYILLTSFFLVFFVFEREMIKNYIKLYK